MSVGATKKPAMVLLTALAALSLAACMPGGGKSKGPRYLTEKVVVSDIERTVRGLVWGAFNNAGQNCASIERVYVDRKIADALVERLVRFTSTLRVGEAVGPLKTPAQSQSDSAYTASTKARSSLSRGRRASTVVA